MKSENACAMTEFQGWILIWLIVGIAAFMIGYNGSRGK